MPTYLLTNEVIVTSLWKLLIDNSNPSEDLTTKASVAKSAVCSYFVFEPGNDQTVVADFPDISEPKKGWRTDWLQGAFQEGTWSFFVRLENNTKYPFSVKVAVRLSKSASPDGSNATLITVSESPNVLDLPASVGGSVSDSWSVSLPTISVDDQYLFAEFRIHIETAADNVTAECSFVCDEFEQYIETPGFVQESSFRIDSAIERLNQIKELLTSTVLKVSYDIGLGFLTLSKNSLGSIYHQAFLVDALLESLGFSSFSADTIVGGLQLVELLTDTLLKGPVSQSLLADVALQVPDLTTSTSVDTLIKKQFVQTLLSSSVFLAYRSQVITIDAVLRHYLLSILGDTFQLGYSYLGTERLVDLELYQSIDALLKRLGIDFSVFSDVLVEKERTLVPTIDMLTKALDIGKLQTVDSLLHSTNIAALLLSDTLLQKLGLTAQTVIDALLTLKDKELSQVVDALLRSYQQRTASIDAVVQYSSLTVAQLLSAVLLKSVLVQLVSDVLIQDLNVTNLYTLDSLLQKKDRLVSFLSDAILHRLGISASYTVDSFLLRTQLISFLSSVVLSKEFISELALSLVLKQPNVVTQFLSDTLLKVLGQSRTFTIDNILKHFDLIASQTISSVLRKYNLQIQYSIDVVIGLIYFKQVVLDALLKGFDYTSTFTADTLLETLQYTVAEVIDTLLQKSYSVDILQNAVIQSADVFRTVLLDSLLRKPDLVTSLSISTILKMGYEFFIDVVLQTMRTAAYTLDMLTQKQNLSILSSASVVLVTLMGAHTIDVLLRATKSRSLTADTLTQTIRTLMISISSAVAMRLTTPLTVDILLKGSYVAEYLGMLMVKAYDVETLFSLSSYIVAFLPFQITFRSVEQINMQIISREPFTITLKEVFE